MRICDLAGYLAALWVTGSVPAFADNPLPLVEHAGTIGAPEFIAVFKNVCLEHFANFPAIEAAFNNNGFDVTPGFDDRPWPTWKVTDDRKGILGLFGFSKVYDDYDYDVCVIDPETMDRKALAADLAAGAPVRQSPPIPRWANGFESTFTRCAADGNEAEISLEWPDLWVHKPSGQTASQRERKKFTLSITRKLKYIGPDLSKFKREGERTPC